MIDVVIHNRTRSRVQSEAFFRRVARTAEPYLKVPRGYRAELGIVLVGPVRMRALNRRYRRVDRSTDVLSFPLHSPHIKGYTAISLGDLFISPSDVPHGRMAWTVIHGLLHLAGYDHEKSPAAAKRMFALEQKILKKL